MVKNINEFPVTVYGQVERYNEVLSKARCRIFYKYGNRNGTYITDQFAEKLLSTIPYTPVKGIFENGDYTDHGEERTEGRIYGIVPENPNVKWEVHTDEDGIEREYACVDVLIFTGLYEEAKEIVGKSQSMELYPPSIKYHQAIVRGQQYVVFDEGSFFGLQVLGDTVEPCFEGASFYSLEETAELQKAIEDTLEKIKKYSANDGGTTMLKFKLSDDDKFSALWTLLNPEYNEEGGWVITHSISKVYDDYALAYNYETGNYERVHYVKNDESDSVELGDVEICYIIDVNEAEYDTLKTLRKLNGDTYELVSENLQNADDNVAKLEEATTQIEEFTAKIDEFNAKVEELNETISTLNTEKEEVSTKYEEVSRNFEEATNNLEQLNSELDELKNYKHEVELNEKMSVIEQYATTLNEEVLNDYRAKVDEFTAEELDMRLAYELKKSNPSVFSKNPTPYIPKEVEPKGIEAILAKYQK